MRSCRRGLFVAFVCVVMSGCALSTAAFFSMGKTPAFNENARIEAVPQAGFTEQLSVVFHPAGLPITRRRTTRRSSTTRSPTTIAPAAPTEVAPPILACKVSQSGENIEYMAATHYGKRWKLAVSIMFVAEAAIAAALLLTDAPDGESNVPRRVGGGLLALDAVGTAGLFFLGKRDVLKTSRRQVTTLVRSDCPEGLVVELEGKSIGVDAEGRLDPLGPELLQRMMSTPSATATARYRNFNAVVDPSAAQRCTWLRARRLYTVAAEVCRQGAGVGQRGAVTAILDLTPGTLSAKR